MGSFARLLCEGGPLPVVILERVARSVPISGLFDLRPLAVNAQLRIDAEEAAAENPLLLMPAVQAPMTVWVGADERRAFIWQSVSMAAAWANLGVPLRYHEAPGRHHFDVIAEMVDADSPLTQAMVGRL